MCKQLTLEEAVKLHRELWNKIADYLESTDISFDDEISFRYIKNRIIQEMGFTNVINNCFLCEYVRQIQPGYMLGISEGHHCYNSCPLYNPRLFCGDYLCLNGLYDKVTDLYADSLRNDESKKELIKTVRKIAELPVIERESA